jgi:hypothetical protein
MIGRALARLGINLPTPRLNPPAQPGHDGDEDADDGSHFILGATVWQSLSTGDITLQKSFFLSLYFPVRLDRAQR